MKDERECRDPAKRSIPARTSLDSVIGVFSCIRATEEKKEARHEDVSRFSYPRKR